MSDWIDKRKQRDAAQEQKTQTLDKLRLHKAEIVKTKVPSFWAALKQCVIADSEKLRREFPTDSQYHISFEHRGDDGFVLMSSIMSPRSRVEVVYTGYSLEIVESKQQSASTSFVENGRYSISIRVTQTDEIEVYYQSHVYRTPAELSESLYSYVLEPI